MNAGRPRPLPSPPPPLWAAAFAAAWGAAEFAAAVVAEPDPAPPSPFPFFLGSALVAAAAFALAAFAARTKGVPVSTLLRRTPRGRGRGAAVALGLAAGAACVGLGPILEPPAEACLRALGIEPVAQNTVRWVSEGAVSPGLALALVAMAFVLAPLTEEILFRALVYGALASRLRPAAALAAQAAFFAAIHGSALAFLPLFALGLALGVAWRFAGFESAVALHAAFNAGNALLLAATLTGP